MQRNSDKNNYDTALTESLRKYREETDQVRSSIIFSKEINPTVNIICDTVFKRLNILNPTIKDEVRQTVLLRVVDKIDKLVEIKRIITYLYGMVTLELRMYFRGSGRYQLRVDHVSDYVSVNGNNMRNHWGHHYKYKGLKGSEHIIEEVYNGKAED